jgi:hypothetical protein
LQERWLEEAKNNYLNCEFLIEECISKVGNIGHTSRHGMDLVDGSDVKTATLHTNFKRYRNGVQKIYEHYYATRIKNVENKIDLLRCIIFNPLHDRLDFLLFKLSEIEFDRTKSNVTVTYNSQKNSYGRLEQFRVKTFEELCQTK